MKNLRKILLSLFFGILINTSIQSITFGHGVLSAFSVFTSVMADEHTAEKAEIKELKIKIYNLDSEPVKRKLVQSDKKYIIAVVPHSKSFDLVIAILIRSYLGLRIKFVGKKELFNPFTSFFFKSIGGIPVNRSITNNFVESVVKLFESNVINILAIAPEGTRKFVKKWKLSLQE